MDMDKAPLNKAHQLERKAEILNRQRKFSECIQCHTEAVELYTKCLESGENKTVLESIQLQKEWNERQIRMLQLKEAYIERTEKEKRLNGLSSTKNTQKEAVEKLEAKIFRNFETHDSLICYLAKRGVIDNPDRICPSTIDEIEERETPFIVGNKHPKDDSTVIEELKELSGQLRESVQGWYSELNSRKLQNNQIIEHIRNLDLEQKFKEGLLIQLDDRNREIDQLKAKIRDLESGRSIEEDTQIEITEKALSPPWLNLTEIKSLPQLEPLSLPELDLSQFKRFQVPELNSKLFKSD